MHRGVKLIQREFKLAIMKCRDTFVEQLQGDGVGIRLGGNAFHRLIGGRARDAVDHDRFGVIVNGCG